MERSSSSVAEYTGSGVSSVRNRPCSLVYASTSRIRPRVAIGELQVFEGLLVHREEPHGGAVFGRHVGHRGAVRQAEGAQPRSVELHELAHHALLAQDLGDGQHQVGGRAALFQAAVELEPHHRRQQHGDGLAQHAGLRLDAAHAPAQHAQAVDHGGVGVRAHHRIGVSHAVRRGTPPAPGIPG